MTNYNFLNSIDFNLNVESSFIYNFYNSLENQIDDNLIADNNFSAYSYINLEIDISDRYDFSTLNYGIYANNFMSDIASLSSRNEDGTLHNLTTSELSLFNKVSDHEKELLTLNLDISRENIKSINDNNEISEQRFQTAINFITQNKKININKSLKEKFYESNKNNLFFTSSTKNSIEKFDSMFRSGDINLNLNNLSKIAENFTPIKTTSASQYFSQSSSSRYNSFYYILTGLLVEKYKVEDEFEVDDEIENNFIKKDTKFFVIDPVSSLLTVQDEVSQNDLLQKQHSISINDSSVKYGSEYFYVVYPVYAFSIPKKNDYYLVETYLMCDYPYFTKNVVCKEFKRPESPNNLRFRYFKKEKHLRLEWAKPFEKQGDVKGYQIFKRKSLKEPYSLIGQIEFLKEESFYNRNTSVSKSLIEKSRFNKTYFTDEDFSLNEVQLYTLCSIDARGQTSNYSEQIAVYYDAYSKEIIVDLVSTAGAPLHMPNLLIPRKTKFYENEENIVSNTPYEERVNKISLYVTPEYNEIKLGEGGEFESLISENYKFSIFKIENSQQVIKDIAIKLQ